MNTARRGFREMVDEALTHIVTLSVEEARKLHGDTNVVFVDLRDPRELEREGLIPGSFHAPRGMLEFWIDPDSPYHKPVFAEPGNSCFIAPAAGARAEQWLDKIYKEIDEQFVQRQTKIVH